LRGTDLVSLDLATGDKEVSGSVRAPDVRPIPKSPSLFVLVDDRGSGEDFSVDPVLSLIDLTGRTQREIGEGFAPMVKPDGAEIAYLRSEGERSCQGEVCASAVSVHVASMNGDDRTLFGPGSLNLLAWAGEDLLVAGPRSVLLVGPNGDARRLPFRPDQLWGASPDGGLVVLVRGGRTDFVDRASKERIPVPIEGRLADGEWSPGGNEFLAVVLTRGRSRLVRVDRGGGVTGVGGSEGAMGPILWGP
jgi:hypothetical protein